MRPRPFGRGIWSRTWSTSDRERSFNEASTFRSRNRGRWSLPGVRRRASMRPRPFGRGIWVRFWKGGVFGQGFNEASTFRSRNPWLLLGIGPRERSFNEASTFRSRNRLLVAGGHRNSRRSFNEASTFRSRNPTTRAPRDPRRGGFNEASTFRSRNQGERLLVEQLRAAASMRPRPFGRGIVPVSNEPEPPELALQ